ncbi:hypothetical protein WA158_006966 [Blastocystis sp. Blastoise]
MNNFRYCTSKSKESTIDPSLLLSFNKINNIINIDNDDKSDEDTDNRLYSTNKPIIQNIVETFLKKKTSKKEEETSINKEIENEIFSCWLELGISDAKIKHLFMLANSIMKRLNPNISLFSIPKRGQDIIRKYALKSGSKLNSINIYNCSKCFQICTYNTKKLYPFLADIQCKNPTCDRNIWSRRRSSA